MTCRHSFVLLLALLLSSPSLQSAEPSRLASRVKRMADSHQGRVAVAIKFLPTGDEYYYNADEPMPTASLIKTAVMVETYRQVEAGKVDLDAFITLEESDKVQGSGILSRHFSDGIQLRVRDAIRLMMAYSDNTATNLVVKQIGLPATAAAMEELGFPNTKLHAMVYRRDTSVFPERSEKFGLGSTTARESIQLLEKLLAGELAAPESTKEMIAHLSSIQGRTTLPRLLPPETKVAYKGGAVDSVRTAAGIIYSPAGEILISVLTADNEDQRWNDENAAQLLIARIAQAAYRYFNDNRLRPGEPLTELAQGAQGWLVEALQRTLNQHLPPAQQLDVDGDYGEVTRKAVAQFQKSKNLPETGVVNAATWSALGTLLTSNRPILDPAEINTREEKLLPPDPLEGAPYVTCKGWVIGDAKTGEVIAGGQHDMPLEMASTTKLMTAWITLRTAKEQPGLLDEIVTISQRSADTPGSTANIEPGEKVTVKELLYGLMLPSGNDASVALGEHLGGRFAPPADDPETQDPIDRFVAEMNRTAAGLGLKQTSYRNTHGLSAEGHKTTPRDLMLLTVKMIEDGSILPYVRTRQYVGKLEGPSGYVRYQLWRNTNQLLDKEGYLGMKTGTTTPAGACLVSLGARENDQLVVVVLGATSSDARYTDTRNLFRWAWQQRLQGK